VIVEVQSTVHHTSVSDRASDDQRRDAMVRAGWQFVEVDEFEVWHRPEVVRQRVRAARSGW
jgi:hypothetical protein